MSRTAGTPRIDQLLLTRFSCRTPDFDRCRRTAGRLAAWYRDPLRAGRLRRRLQLFELVCLPSVLAQSQRDFAWALIVDRALGAPVRARLEALVAPLPRARLVEYSPEHEPHGLGWLDAQLVPDATHLITTNLDDDDALPSSYLAGLREAVMERSRNEALAPLLFLGDSRILQWDLLRTPACPLGWRSPWHRQVRVTSCGFSLACELPSAGLNVLGFQHQHAASYLARSQPERTPEQLRAEAIIDATLARAGGWARPLREPFVDLAERVGPVLVTNHAHNKQRTRLLETKPHREAVTGPESFPGIGLDWPAIRVQAHTLLRRERRGALRKLLRRVRWR